MATPDAIASTIAIGGILPWCCDSLPTKQHPQSQKTPTRTGMAPLMTAVVGETIPIWPRTKAAYNNAIALERITPVASASPNNSLDALSGTSILRVRRQLHSGYLIEIGLAKVATG